ncbi:unnamed protein product, partial [Heligmosomoides polygyrus]|uniref:Tudor domain-containing protein n=1 Tax=Heligmosomoides polygyrus TaxID=6339 RepID=A0A183FCD5_HELPZ
MENQFNHHHGAKPRAFKPGQLVYARRYQGKESWTEGLVVKRIGRVLYKIKVEDELWTRHANQLRTRLYDSDNHRTKDMDTLFETFDLERPHSLSRPANIQNSTAPALPEFIQLSRTKTPLHHRLFQCRKLNNHDDRAEHADQRDVSTWIHAR